MWSDAGRGFTRRARDQEDVKKLQGVLNTFAQIQIPDDLWDKLGIHLRELRSRGMVVPFTDAVLMTVALEQGLELWAFDRHFQQMATVFPLKLYQPVLS